MPQPNHSRNIVVAVFAISGAGFVCCLGLCGIAGWPVWEYWQKRHAAEEVRLKTPIAVGCDNVFFGSRMYELGPYVSTAHFETERSYLKQEGLDSVGTGELFVQLNKNPPQRFHHLKPADMAKLNDMERTVEMKEGVELVNYDHGKYHPDLSFTFEGEKLVAAFINLKGDTDQLVFCNSTGTKTVKLPALIAEVTKALGEDNCALIYPKRNK